MTLHRPLARAVALALALSAAPAVAQRASLADRVAVLEQRAANPQQGLDLLNQLGQLRTEVQSLRAQLEEMQQVNEQLKATARTQYLDVDGRLQRLETGGASARPPATPISAPGVSGVAPATAPAVVPARTPAAAPVRREADPGRRIPPSLDGMAMPTGNELAAYNLAFDALKAGRYADASRLFGDFLDRYPGGVYAPNALYWLGESYYGTRNFEEAIGPFTQLLERFPTHDKAPGGLLKLGLTRLSLRQDDAARAAFDGVVERYPGTDAARSAADRLRAMGVPPQR